MSITPDMYFLDRAPSVGDTVGLAGSGATVIVDQTEQTAYGASTSAGFAAPSGSTGQLSTFEVNATTYETAAIDHITFLHAGGSATGHVITIVPAGGGDPQFLFVPDDDAGNLDLSALTITSTESVAFLSSAGIANDDDHRFVACFAAGTLIETPTGLRPVEAISPGDLVCTLDHGPQPCLLRLDRQVQTSGHLPVPWVPVFIPKDAIGPGQPSRALHLSRQHRVLLRGPHVLAETGANEVLAAAKDLCGWNGICLDRLRQSVRYVHLVLSRHEIIRAEGMDTESFFAAERGIAKLRLSLQDPGFAVHRPARPIVTGESARDLVRTLRAGPPGSSDRDGKTGLFSPA